MQEVVVINKHPFEHSDSYAGTKYIFKSGVKVTIPLAAAVHCFGLGVGDRVAAMKRAGKNNRQDGEKFLDGFSMTPIEYVPKEVADEVVTMKVDLENQAEEIERLQKENEKLAKSLSDANVTIDSLKQQLAEKQQKK